MCIHPETMWIKRGLESEQLAKPCGFCWRCKENRLGDYVARAMCEASTSHQCCTINMTYAPRGDLADKVVTPRHFQLFMKRLRKAGHKIRYLVAGEYGELNGRAHFHAILFFQDLRPRAEGKAVPAYKAPAPFCREIPQERMVHIDEWPHGHVTVDWSASEKSIRYVCKYILKDDKQNAWFSLSKKPTIGWAWFAQKAAKMKELGVMPRSFEYMPPGGRKGHPYLMTGATRRDYLKALDIDPSDLPNASEWVQKSVDKLARQEARAADAIDVERFEKELAARPANGTEAMLRHESLLQWYEALDAERREFDEGVKTLGEDAINEVEFARALTQE